VIDIELRGGLGDCFIGLHETTAYDEIEALKPDERIRVTIISHNPFADEIFRWHPKSTQIEIVRSRHFFNPPYDNPRIRREAGIPEQPPPQRPPRTRAPIRFYPSPEDLELIESALPKRPFLAIAPTSSGMEIENRNIPMPVVTQIYAATRRRVPVVFLGRTYTGPHARKDAPRRPDGPGIVDFTDRLSVPGTAEVVKRAQAMVCAHSALLLLSWYERKPNFTMYPPKYKWHDFDNPSPFGFGKNYPETVRMLFSEFTVAKFHAFLEKNFPKEGRK
jgi:hypothetical protein